MNIVNMALRLATAVARYSVQARQFFYEAVLFEHRCPRCNGALAMIGESRCRCSACGYVLDPTSTFQRCSGCGGTPKIQVRHYRCSQCGGGIEARFLFDGLVFDAEYFRQKMAEHRTRQAEQSEHAREIAVLNRSGPLESEPADLDSVPGLVQALNDLTEVAEIGFPYPLQSGFNLSRYQSHIRAQLQTIPILFDRIPPLENDVRKDRIWRFVALIFMAHAGVIDLRQQGQDIQVIQCETD
jgi:hypothetical protein